MALARSAVDEQGPRPWPYIYELVSMTPITSKDGKPSMALKALFHYRGFFGGAIQILVFLRVTLIPAFPFVHLLRNECLLGHHLLKILSYQNSLLLH